MNKYHALITSLFTCTLLADDINQSTENVINKGVELESNKELSVKGIKSNELIRKQQYELEGDGQYYQAINFIQVGNYTKALQKLKSAEMTYLKVSSSAPRIMEKLSKINADSINVYNSSTIFVIMYCTLLRFVCSWCSVSAYTCIPLFSCFLSMSSLSCRSI